MYVVYTLPKYKIKDSLVVVFLLIFSALCVVLILGHYTTRPYELMVLCRHICGLHTISPLSLV